MEVPGASKAPLKDQPCSANPQGTNSEPEKWQPAGKHACTQMVGSSQHRGVKPWSAVTLRLTLWPGQRSSGDGSLIPGQYFHTTSYKLPCFHLPCLTEGCSLHKGQRQGQTMERFEETAQGRPGFPSPGVQDSGMYRHRVHDSQGLCNPNKCPTSITTGA